MSDSNTKIFGIAVPLVAAVFAYLLLFLLPFTPIFSETDQLIFIHEGTRLLQGDVMYRDFFQFTFPGAQAFYAVVLSVFGEQYWVLPASVIVLSAVLAALCLKLSRAAIGGWIYLLPPAIFVFFGLRWFGLDGSHRMFSPVFLLLAAWVLIRGNRLRNYAFAGIFCAAASFFTQQRGVAAIAAFLLFLILEAIMGEYDWKAALKRSAVIIAAFLVTLAALLSYFIFAAGPAEFVQATIEYPLKYYKYAPANNYGVFIADIALAARTPGLSGLLMLAVSLFYAVIMPLAVLGAFVLFALKTKNEVWTSLRVPMLLAILGATLLLTTSGPGPIRFFQVGIPGLVLIGWLLSRIEVVRRFDARITAASLAFLVLIGIFQAIRFQTHWDFTRVETPSGELAFIVPDQADLYRYLAERTTKGEFIYQVSQPYVYFPLGVRNPTAISQVWPTGYTRPEHVEMVIQGLKSKQPRFIVWNNNYNIPAGSREPGDFTAPLSDFVVANYTPVGGIYSLEHHRIQVWERIGPQAEHLLR
jgi:hypothetical protein